MRIFITGANGFISGAVASPLIGKATVSVASFVNQGNADAVAALGIDPVIGSLDESALLQAEAGSSEGVVMPLTAVIAAQLKR